jgi:metal-responsive CopG/Arc/MetJ family transcriptional regulator
MDFKPVLAKIGRPRIVEGRSVNVSVSISSDLDDRLGRLAEAMDTPRASIIRAAIVGLVEQAESESVIDAPKAAPAPVVATKSKRK